MVNNEDRPVNEASEAAAPAGSRRAKAGRQASRFTWNARTAPRGAESRIGDDETHRRLQEARNRASHTTEDLVRRYLGPEWARD
jgi:hypothetical protein